MSKYFDKESLRDAMSSLYDAGVKGKLYRLWFMMNCDNQVKVLTSVGMTGIRATGENVGQGTVGGAILSSLNLDVGVTDGFSESDHEIYYGGKIRLNPLLYQDDSLRMATSVSSAQYGNNIMESVMNRKLLTINDKSSYLVCGKHDQIRTIQDALARNPLSIKGEEIKRKSNEKYLGEIISSYGVADSVKATIKDRKGRIIASIYELSSIIEDFRMQVAGGLMSGLKIWMFGLLPSLLANSEMWTEISEDDIKSLEDIQHLLLQRIFAVPKTTPHVALRWDTGAVSLEMEICKRKLLFLHHVINMDESSLAREIFDVQKSEHLPGLVSECKSLLKSLNLPNILDIKVAAGLSKVAWKRLVKDAIKEIEVSKLKKQISTKSKLKDGPMSKEDFKIKDYLGKMTLDKSRMNFKMRSKMMDVKFNYSAKHEKELWLCDSCCSSIETQSHLLFCPAYSTLREGKDLLNDDHLIEYVQKVMHIRSKMNLRK